MIILDTCALIFDALTPKKLSAKAKSTILKGEKENNLYLCDISLWEISMLITKKRISPGIDTDSFLRFLVQARSFKILAITSEIAALSTEILISHHTDPADSLIAATAFHHEAFLVTCDKKLQQIHGLNLIW